MFTFYLDKEQNPLTRYLNRQNPKLKSYLPQTGRPNIQQIIAAAQEDPDVLVVNQSVLSEGEQIGQVAIALDMTEARNQALESQ